MSFATVDGSITEARVAEFAASDDPILVEAAREIATIDHEAVFHRGVELFIAGLAVSPAPS